MNREFKNSIARRLTIRVSAALAAAFLLLLVGVFFSLNREVRQEGLHYAKVIVGIYADVTAYDAHNMDKPLDESVSDRFDYFGEYMCTWYRVDYLYAYIPDIENGTITYLSVAKDREKFGDLADDHMTGVTENHVLTPGELEAWNDGSVFAIEKNTRFEKATDVMMSIADESGNKVMVGAAVSTDDQRRSLINVFSIVALMMLLIVAALAVLLYMLINRLVSEPASRISKKMSDYVSGFKKSSSLAETYNEDEFSMIDESFDHMTEEMDKYIGDIERLGREQERQRAEVDIAAEIQKGILSPENASLEKCGIKSVMIPAKYIGGDLYDYLQLDDNRTMIVVADVSGKGIPSSLLMAVALTLIRQFAMIGYSPARILKHVNENFAKENPKLMFITAFVGIYDSGKNLFTYANAGHNPPYLIHNEPFALDASDGTPLGLFQGEEYVDVDVRMEEGDSVFLYTDGVNEAVNEAGEFYGVERLVDTLRKTSESGVNHFVESVEASVRAFAGKAEQNDDITMLCLCARKNIVLELDYDIGQFSMIRDRLLSSLIPNDFVMDLCVAAEECFVNICSYAFDGPVPDGEKIQFYLEYSDKVVMRFSDGGKQFDPRNGLPDIEDYDIDTAIGGLGRLIAFTVADDVDYEYKDGRNVLTITKLIKE